MKNIGKLVVASTFSAGLVLVPNILHAIGEANILNVSPSDYVQSAGKKLSDYNMFGVHSGASRESSCLVGLVREVNKNFPTAEVVVNFTYNHGNWQICYGTVLTPKKSSS